MHFCANRIYNNHFTTSKTLLNHQKTSQSSASLATNSLPLVTQKKNLGFHQQETGSYQLIPKIFCYLCPVNGNVCRAFYFNKNKKQQMGKVLIIGAGGVGTVVAHKVAQNPDVFTDIMIASYIQNELHLLVRSLQCPDSSLRLSDKLP